MQTQLRQAVVARPHPHCKARGLLAQLHPVEYGAQTFWVCWPEYPSARRGHRRRSWAAPCPSVSRAAHGPAIVQRAARPRVTAQTVNRSSGL